MICMHGSTKSNHTWRSSISFYVAQHTWLSISNLTSSSSCKHNSSRAVQKHVPFRILHAFWRGSDPTACNYPTWLKILIIISIFCAIQSWSNVLKPCNHTKNIQLDHISHLSMPSYPWISISITFPCWSGCEPNVQSPCTMQLLLFIWLFKLQL